MKKGLTLTLMTVAIALVSVQAMAMAPTIGDIPSPIVGSAEPVTGGSKFVYIDAFNITTCATDDATSSTNLLWTYTGSRDTHGASHYRINGIAPLDLTVTTNDPTAPTAAQTINKTIGSINSVAEWNQDGTPRTVTVRNQTLSPLGAADTGFSGAAGIIAAETEAVTFFVSDGSSYSQKTVFFYSDNGGADRLSGGGKQWTNLKDDKLASSAELAKWHADATNSPASITKNFVASPASGICLDAGSTGAAPAGNIGSWYTDWGYLTLTANQIYRIKLTMNGSQTVKGTVPLWDFLISNFRSPHGINAYNLDQYYYDAANGANAVVSAAGGTPVTVYFTPLAVKNAQWNSTMFTAAHSAEKDAELIFRMLDVDAIGAGSAKFGTVCVTGCTIDSIPYDKLTEGASLANITSFVDHNAGGTGNSLVTTLWGNNVGTNVSFTGGVIKLTPNAGANAGQSFELAEVDPAQDTNVQNSGNMTTSYLDDWPIPWADQSILKLEAGISAPTATDAAHPWDAIQLGFEPLSDELIGQSWASSSYNAGSPSTTVQPYVYLYSTGRTSALAQYRQLRWRVSFVNNTAASFPSNIPTTDPVNTGAVQLNYLKVNTVTLPVN